jgi:methionyl aminopeptidase
MIFLKNNSEIEKLYYAGQIVKETLLMLEEHIVPGITTLDLDKLAEEFILSKKSKPGFKGLYDYPATLCTSVDDQVVHGLPNDTKLKEGQIVGIDVGSIYEDYYGDHAKTFSVGSISLEKKKLMNITEECLYMGINEAKIGNKIGDIGYSIQKHAESHGFSIVRELVGHGIGKKLHEEPQVPNFGIRGTGVSIESGMCLAIEPMINMGSYEVYTKQDNWTVCTKDGKPSAHFEHSIAITEDGVKILSK